MLHEVYKLHGMKWWQDGHDMRWLAGGTTVLLSNHFCLEDWWKPQNMSE